MKPTRAFLVAAAAAFIAAPAAAFVDEATGLTVEPPAPFEAIAGKPRPNYDVVVNVKSTSGKPSAAGSDGNLCGVAYKLAPQNAALSQSDINERLTQPQWLDTIKAPFQAWSTIERTEVFEQDGVKGVELTVAPKAGPNHESVRMYLALWETPKGRTVVSCATKVDEMPQALAALQSIRRATRVRP